MYLLDHTTTGQARDIRTAMEMLQVANVQPFLRSGKLSAYILKHYWRVYTMMSKPSSFLAAANDVWSLFLREDI